MIRGSISESTQQMISRVLRGFTPSELSSPADSVEFELTSAEIVEVELEEFYDFLCVKEVRAMYSTDRVDSFINSVASELG